MVPVAPGHGRLLRGAVDDNRDLAERHGRGAAARPHHRRGDDDLCRRAIPRTTAAQRNRSGRLDATRRGDDSACARCGRRTVDPLARYARRGRAGRQVGEPQARRELRRGTDRSRVPRRRRRDIDAEPPAALRSGARSQRRRGGPARRAVQPWRGDPRRRAQPCRRSLRAPADAAALRHPRGGARPAPPAHRLQLRPARAAPLPRRRNHLGHLHARRHSDRTGFSRAAPRRHIDRLRHGLFGRFGGGRDTDRPPGRRLRTNGAAGLDRRQLPRPRLVRDLAAELGSARRGNDRGGLRPGQRAAIFIRRRERSGRRRTGRSR